MNIEIYSSSQAAWVSITPMIGLGGVKWTRNDVDGPNAGRNIEGTMERDRVATKIRLDITCTMLTSTSLSTLLNLIYPEYVHVRYSDPMLGTRTVWMYSNNNPAVFSHYDLQSQEWWKEITFPLIEV